MKRVSHLLRFDLPKEAFTLGIRSTYVGQAHMTVLTSLLKCQILNTHPWTWIPHFPTNPMRGVFPEASTLES